MLCPLVPCSSRAKETTVSSPVSNGQPILFLLGISLLWLQLYMYVTKLVIFFFNYFWVALYWFLFFFGAFVVFVHISRLLGWFMPSVFFCCFCCCWNYVPILSASSTCCRLVHDHPFSLCIGWSSISKSGLIRHFLSNPRNLVHFFCFLCFVFCYLIIVLVWCHPVYFCLMGCFCLHRAFLVTHVQELTGKKIHHHSIFYHCG